MRMNWKDWFIAATAMAVIAIACGALYFLQTPVAQGMTIFVSVGVLLVLIIELYRRQVEMLLVIRAKQSALETRIVHSVQEVQSLIFLHAYLEPKRPLPLVGDWAASSDFLAELVSMLIEQRPEFVVDLGSGITTVVAAYCLEKNGKGRILSLDHDGNFAEKTRQALIAHGLSHRARVVHAPLVETSLGGERWLWYDQGALAMDGAVDILIVDGPPGPTRELARYPALPLLYGCLNREAVVVLDDAARPDEQKIAKRWVAEFPDLSSEYLPLQKGLFVFRRG